LAIGGLRANLAEISNAWMAGACGFEKGYADPLGERLVDPRVPLVEFAHTPQMPHMGVVRQFLVAQRLARRLDGVLVYAVNDHLPAAELPESRYLPFKVSDRVVPRSPQFGPGKKLGKSGMAWLAAPDDAALQSFVQRWRELQPERKARIDAVAEILRGAAQQCTSFAAWLTRVTIELLQLELAAVPTTEFAEISSEPMETIKKRSDAGWACCANCGYRSGRWPIANNTHCRKCGHTAFRFLPDVVSRQLGMNLAPLAYRICGQAKPYQDEADQATRRTFEVEAPQRIKVTGKTVIRSESSGETINRMNLLQVVSTIGGIENWPPLPKDEHDDWVIQVP